MKRDEPKPFTQMMGLAGVCYFSVRNLHTCKVLRCLGMRSAVTPAQAVDVCQMAFNLLDVGAFVLRLLTSGKVCNHGSWPTCRCSEIVAAFFLTEKLRCSQASELPQVTTVPSARIAAKAPDEASSCCTSRSFSLQHVAFYTKIVVLQAWSASVLEL